MDWGRKALRCGVVAALALSAAIVFAPGAAADAPPAGSAWYEAYLPSDDGTVLHADVFRPTAPTAANKGPVMLAVGPYFGLPSAPDGASGPPTVLHWYRSLYETAIARGYTIVQVSIRGTGASAGCEDLGGPGEQSDVRAAVSWARHQPWSNGRVGMIGHSYDGMLAVSALAQKLKLSAAVLMAPAISEYRAVYMNGVRYLQTPAIAPYYQAFGLIPPLSGSEAASTIQGRDLTCAAGVVAQAQDSDPDAAFWRERDFTRPASRSSVPVLWTHGFLDGRDDESGVRPDNFLDVWKGLQGPKQAWFGQFPHVVPGQAGTFAEPEEVGRDGFDAEALDWLDAYVKRDRAARKRVHARPAVSVQEGAEGRWRSALNWPPRNAHDHSMDILPGTYTDAPGNKAEQGDGPGGSCQGIQARCNPLSRTGQGTWTFSQPLPHPVHLAGVPRLQASVETRSPQVELVAIVYDVDPSGAATLLTRGAALAHPGTPVSFDLYPQDWRLEAGHRIGVLLTGSDDFYFAPGMSLGSVDVTGGELTVPLTNRLPRLDLEGSPSRAVAERTTFPVSLGARESALDLP